MMTQAEIAQVEQAIGAMELQTNGELLVVLLGRSHSYWPQRALAVASLLLVSSLLLVTLEPSISLLDVVLLQGWLAVASYWLLGRAWLLSRLLGANQRQKAVAQRARQLFVNHGVGHTKDKTGILLLVSMLERRVYILADSGIDRYIGSQGWQQYVDQVVEGIAQQRLADALCATIGAIGQLLARYVPKTEEDRNELPNQVVLQAK